VHPKELYKGNHAPQNECANPNLDSPTHNEGRYGVGGVFDAFGVRRVLLERHGVLPQEEAYTPQTWIAS
jgi:hypothetical protein